MSDDTGRISVGQTMVDWQRERSGREGGGRESVVGNRGETAADVLVAREGR